MMKKTIFNSVKFISFLHFGTSWCLHQGTWLTQLSTRFHYVTTFLEVRKELVLRSVKSRWESGNPVARPECTIFCEIVMMHPRCSINFKKCGFDAYDEGREMFFAHEEALNEDSIYQSLLASNKANNWN